MGDGNSAQHLHSTPDRHTHIVSQGLNSPAILPQLFLAQTYKLVLVDTYFLNVISLVLFGLVML